MRIGRRFLVVAATASLAACSEPGPAPRPSTTPSASPEPSVEVAALLAPRAVVHPSGGESYVNPGLVVREGGRLHMLTNSFSRYPGASFVSHLTSVDGIEWRPVEGGPVLSNEQVPTAHETFTTSFLTAGTRSADGTWMAYGYTFEGPSADGFIWRATAPRLDGPWRVDRRPAVAPGAAGSWDSVRVAEPSVVETADGYLLFYTGFDDAGVARIGAATSPDGVAWTKRAEPVFEGGAPWDGGSVGNPQVVSTPDGYVMTYRTEAGGFGFGLARSEDGFTWQPSAVNPIMTEDRSPRGEPFWQSEAAVIGEEVRWWLEVGLGSASTRLFAFRLDLAAAW